ncbi:MAG: MATE family efflux transporter [Paracoccaceae bacterium]
MADRPPEITHRRVLKIAIPIVIANATVPILGAVDTGVVGQLGQAAPIGAVGIGAVILSGIYWIFGFLRMGTTGMVAQARGAGDAPETGALLMRGLIVAAAAGVGFIVLQAPVFRAALEISPATPRVEALAGDYLAIRIWGAPAAIAVFALTGWLIAMERTRAVLAVLLSTNGLNIGLDLLFVLRLGWGVEGVAVATLIAEWTGAALALWFCGDAFGGRQWRNWPRVFDWGKIRRMAAVNRDIMLRSVLVQVAFIGFLFVAGGLGDVALAANQILIQFLHITAYTMDGFAIAAETLVGQALGARARPVLRRSAIVTSQWGAVVVIALSLFFLLAGDAVVAVMATSEEVRAAAGVYLPWMAAMPLVGWAAWMLDGIFIGATRSREMRNAMLVSVAVYAVAALVLPRFFGNHGLWAALMAFNATRAVTLGLRYPALEAAADG